MVNINHLKFNRIGYLYLSQNLPRLFTLILFLFLCRAHAEKLVKIEENFAVRADVKEFIKNMVQKYHFNEHELVKLFSAVKLRPKVISSIKSPLEQNPWRIYKLIYVTQQRVNKGVVFWDKYQASLAKAEQIYGVPASIIVATIGIESKYGQTTGEFRVIDALVNLAFSEHTNRKNFFRKELTEFLLLTREKHLNPLKVMGSYAGAIGQPQFMPSSYRFYAVNFSGTPPIDLSNNEIDVIGSIANYYQKNGWQKNQPVTIPASLRGGRYQLGFSKPKNISLSELITESRFHYNPLLNNKNFKLIELEADYGKEYWIAFPNFDVIKRYNHNNLYAMAVFQLSHHISALRGESCTKE